MALIIALVNVSNLAPVSSYQYQVLIGDGTPERSRSIASGTLTGHLRANGWQALVQQMLDANPAPAPAPDPVPE